MLTVHRTTIVGKCPHGCPDVYEAEFHVTGLEVLAVEVIQRAIFDATLQPIYQEDLTKNLGALLGCKVVTRGRHSAFDTECTCEPSVVPPDVQGDIGRH